MLGLTVPDVTPTTTGTETGNGEAFTAPDGGSDRTGLQGPPMFLEAVRSLVSYKPRAEISLKRIKAPQRLAPYAFGIGCEIDGPGEDEEDAATARLILLHDPDGQESWDGVLRLVGFLRADVDSELAADPLLPEVGWSWLTEGLEQCGASFTALGGTVTQTTSARFGDIAGPEHACDLEVRASWTPLGTDLAAHTEAFCGLLASAVGLPPVGISMLSQRDGSR